VSGAGGNGYQDKKNRQRHAQALIVVHLIGIDHERIKKRRNEHEMLLS